MISKMEQEGGKKKGDEDRFHLLVEGVGLQEVMTRTGVVGKETTSNNVMEIYHVLGIEAARYVSSSGLVIGY